MSRDSSSFLRCFQLIHVDLCNVDYLQWLDMLLLLLLLSPCRLLPLPGRILLVVAPGRFPMIRSWIGFSIHITSTVPVKYGVSTSIRARGNFLIDSFTSAQPICRPVSWLSCIIQALTTAFVQPVSPAPLLAHLQFTQSMKQVGLYLIRVAYATRDGDRRTVG